MNISNIKKIVLEEGKVVVVDGDDALVVMSFSEYKKLKSPAKQASLIPEIKPEIKPELSSASPEPSPVLPESDTVIPPELSSALPSQELTLDDLPF